MYPIALPIKDAVSVSGLSRSEIYRQLTAGKLAAIKAGRRTLIDAESLKAHMASLPRATFRQPSTVAA